METLPAGMAEVIAQGMARLAWWRRLCHSARCTSWSHSPPGAATYAPSIISVTWMPVAVTHDPLEYFVLLQTPWTWRCCWR
jgi:hypothetical protein